MPRLRHDLAAFVSKEIFKFRSMYILMVYWFTARFTGGWWWFTCFANLRLMAQLSPLIPIKVTLIFWKRPDSLCSIILVPFYHYLIQRCFIENMWSSTVATMTFEFWLHVSYIEWKEFAYVGTIHCTQILQIDSWVLFDGGVENTFCHQFDWKLSKKSCSFPIQSQQWLRNF